MWLDGQRIRFGAVETNREPKNHKGGKGQPEYFDFHSERGNELTTGFVVRNLLLIRRGIGDALARQLAEQEAEAGLTDEDEVPDVPTVPVTKPGDPLAVVPSQRALATQSIVRRRNRSWEAFQNAAVLLERHHVAQERLKADIRIR